jgi:hypothetical protein
MPRRSSSTSARGKAKRSSSRPKPLAVNPFARSETDISGEIGAFLDLLMRAGRLWHTRLNSGRVRSANGGWVHLCRKGTPDRMVIDHGKVLFFEVKKPGEVATKEQLEQHALLRAQGAEVHVVYSASEVSRILVNAS